jgi:hypothetical protein
LEKTGLPLFSFLGGIFGGLLGWKNYGYSDGARCFG